MAHALRYYKDLEQPNGTIIRLEIHRKTDGDALWVSKEIGRVVQALHLDIQGGADTIDAPIVKTSLTMTFVDAPDLEEGKKCGDWEEFYTPDSTMWKVVLKANGNTIWGGYITPDSYCEDLRYRGSVTIIARDNIGHMQDFPFDAEGDENGMISLLELVEGAWAKIESPMQLYWDAGLWMRTEDDIIAYHTRMNVSAFEDMNWYDAVEKALYSYGAVLRYIGGNEVQVCSLRYMPQQGRGDINKVPRISPIFVAHAQRELAPAARRIEESVKYELTDGQQMPLAKNVTFTGAESTCRFRSVNIFGETQWKTIPVHPISRTSGEGWNNTLSTTLLFNPKEYTIRENALKDDAERMLFLACNTDGANSVRFTNVVVCQPFNIGITFGRPIERDSYGGVAYCYGFSNSSDTTQNGIGSISAQTVDCYITCEQNGITQYFNGNKWQTESVKITLNVENRQCGIDLSFSDLVGVATLTLTVVNVELNGMRDYSDGYGLYIPISSMKFGVVNALTLCETNRVNTNYIDSNNVIVSRSPELAPALDDVPFPAVIKNGIFVKSGSAYLPANEWYWPNNTPQQMAVYNHLQLLCYHGKPNNVISGDITNVNFENIATIYEWNGTEHILVSGSYNFISGRLESAVLREFTRYEDMWGDASGTSLPDTEQNNRTTAESGSGAAKSSTYSNATTVYIGSTGGGGSSTLAGLEDVNVTSVEDGQFLMFQDGVWVPQNVTGGGSIIVDTQMSDTSTNPVQNKVVKKYIDDYDVYLEGYAEQQAIDAEKAAKQYTDDKIAQIEIGEGGLKYVEERTVYPSKMIVDGEEADSYELSETQKAYNIETLDKAINERSVIIVVAGYIFQFVYSESDSTERIGKFSYVGEIDNNLLSVSITINQDGDAIWEQKVLELGEGGEGGSDSSSFRTIHIGEADELTEEQKRYNIETRNRIINDDNAPVIVLGNALGTPGMHSSNGELKSVSVTFKLIMELEAAYMVALINADGTVTIESEYYAPIYCDLRNAEHAYIFFGTRDIFYEAKGIITGEYGTMYEVDAYNLESRFVEYNKGDKRYRVMFDESYNITEEIDITPSNGGGGDIDTSNLATKDELNNLTNEVIANEEVHAAALNDLNERKADKEYVENALKNIDTSDLATKEEVQNLTDEIIANEEVHAAALVDLDARIQDIVARLNNAGL